MALCGGSIGLGHIEVQRGWREKSFDEILEMFTVSVDGRERLAGEHSKALDSIRR